MGDLNVYQRLANVMKQVSYIQKEQKQGMRYSIVSHDAVTKKVRPALLENGIVYHPVQCNHIQNGNRAECSMVVRFLNIDKPDDYFDVPTFGYGIDNQDKGPGMAMSYAVKYALLKALGLETGDDADYNDKPHETFDKDIHDAAVRAAIRTIETEPTLEGLIVYWRDLAANQKAVANDKNVFAAKEKRKSELTPQKDAA